MRRSITLTLLLCAGLTWTALAGARSLSPGAGFAPPPAAATASNDGSTPSAAATTSNHGSTPASKAATTPNHGSTTPTHGSTPAPAAVAAAGHVLPAIRPEVTWSHLPLTAARSRIVILLPWQQALMHRLKAANPHLIVLEYKDLSNASSYPLIDGVGAGGVSYAQALEGHPSWLLRNLAGQPIQCQGYPYLWALNIGNLGFQRAWASEVVNELTSQGWDGVFIDNVDPTIRYYYAPADVAQYPSDASYAAATTAALAYIAPRIHAASKLVMANIGSWPNYAQTGTRWLKYLDGAMDEHFVKYTDTPGRGYRSIAEWRTELSILQRSQREDKWFIGLTESSVGDAAAARYGWASMLLGASGRATFALQNDTNYGVETWFPDYDAPIGRALAPAQAEPSGVYRRRFSNGLVLVNPTAATHTVELGRRYSGNGLRDSSLATMAPHTGLILTRAIRARIPRRGRGQRPCRSRGACRRIAATGRPKPHLSITRRLARFAGEVLM